MPEHPEHDPGGYGYDPAYDAEEEEDDFGYGTDIAAAGNPHRHPPREHSGHGGSTAITGRGDQLPRVSDCVWRPLPVERPVVDPDLRRMRWPERAAEVIRYSTLRLERWLSPNGALREWVRLNLRVGVVTLAAALLVVPPVSMLLRGGAEWSELLKSSLLNVSDTVSGMPPIVIALGALLIGGRFLQRRWLGRRRRGNYHDGY